jgi:predicted RNA polymerase sigma factor
VLQASIAACDARATSAAVIDWHRIAELYFQNRAQSLARQWSS